MHVVSCNAYLRNGSTVLLHMWIDANCERQLTFFCDETCIELEPTCNQLHICNRKHVYDTIWNVTNAMRMINDYDTKLKIYKKWRYKRTIYEIDIQRDYGVYPTHLVIPCNVIIDRDAIEICSIRQWFDRLTSQYCGSNKIIHFKEKVNINGWYF